MAAAATARGTAAAAAELRLAGGRPVEPESERATVAGLAEPEQPAKCGGLELEDVEVRQNKWFSRSILPDLKSLEAKSNQGTEFGTQGLKWYLADPNTTVQDFPFTDWCSLGNQNLSPDMLALAPITAFNGLQTHGEPSTVSRHRRRVENCRIGEAANPGPGLDNKQHKQLNMCDFFGKTMSSNIPKLNGARVWDSESKTSKEMELVFTHVWGQTLEMDQVRNSIVEQSNMHWKGTMDLT
eukprot:8289254-Heterocapsa_arctica.AAC.2